MSREFDGFRPEIFQRRPVQLEHVYPYPLFQGDPSHPWEVAAFNPSVIAENGLIRMIYRGTTNDGRNFKPGQYLSSICYAESQDGINFTRHGSIISPDQPYERDMGCEDGSIQKIGDTYYIYYTAVGNRGIRIGLATSRDFMHWEKHGIVGPDLKSKSATLLPLESGEVSMLYTINTESPQSAIMHARFKNLEEATDPPEGFMNDNAYHYEENVLLGPSSPSVHKGPEIGAPPIKTDKGWLLIFSPEHSEKHDEWSVNAALLDRDDPSKVLSITKQPILKPDNDIENGPICKNCVFPRGALVRGNELFVYHGAGDNGVCLSKGNMTAIMQELLTQ